MSTFTNNNKITAPLLDGPNDLKPEVKTTFIKTQEAAAAAAEAAKKKAAE